MRRPTVALFVLVMSGCWFLLSAQERRGAPIRAQDLNELAGHVVRTREQDDAHKQLFAILEKKIATAERWVGICERVSKSQERASMSGRASSDDLTRASRALFDARIALATARQQLYAARVKYESDGKAVPKVGEAIEQKVMAGRELVKTIKQHVASAESLYDAGRMVKSELDRQRAELIHAELDVLEFQRELAEFHLEHAK